MTRGEIKKEAQEQIMLAVANACLSFQDNLNYLDKRDRALIEEEIRTQANRVAKIMGYQEAWHN